MRLNDEKQKVVNAIMALVDSSELDESDVLEIVVATAGCTLQALSLTGVTIEGATGKFTLTVDNK